MKQRIAVYITVLLSFSFLLLPTVSALTPVPGISLQISPLPIELTVKPGSSTKTDLRVRNAGSQPEKLQVHILKVSEDDNGVVHLAEPTKSDDWVHWINFSKPVFDAPPGQWQTITMTTNVPKDAAFGYYYAVEYKRANEAAGQPGATAAHGAVATFILLNADAPGAKREAEIVSFKADHSTYEFLPANFAVKVRATGNVHVAPHGNIFITKGGKQVDSILVNEAEGSILPNSSRFFGATWNNGFPHYVVKTGADGQPILDKHGQPQKTLQWDFSKVNHLRFGRYTAHLVMVYDNGQRDVPIEATVSFWVIPWRLIVGGIVVVILIGLGIWTLLRRVGKFANKGIKKVKKSEK